jgi:hypothetical protein
VKEKKNGKEGMKKKAHFFKENYLKKRICFLVEK